MPLRRAWYGLIIIASLLPAIALSPWLSQQAHNLLLDRALLKEEMFHKEVEIFLHLETNRLVSVLQNKSDPIAHFLTEDKNYKAIRKLTERIAQREPMVNTTSVYDEHANMIIRSLVHGHQPAVIDMNSPAFVIPMHNRIFIGSPQRLSDQHYEFLISVPVVHEGTVVGVIVSTVNIDEYWKNVRTQIPEHNSKVYLIDGRGSLLVHQNETNLKQGDLLSDKKIVRSILAGKDWHETSAYEGFEGNQVFGIATLVRGLQWGLISEVEAKEITSAIVSKLTLLIIIVVLLHALFGLISLIFTGRLLEPIFDLGKVMKRATEGDYSNQACASPYVEIDDLSRSFNMMIQEIEVRELSLKKLSQAIEQGGESVIMTDKHGVIEYVNPAFTEITGYSSDEVVGKKPNILKSGVQSAEYYKKLWLTISSGEVWHSSIVDQRKDGSTYPALMTVSPIIDAKGNITHYVGIQQDMSAHEMLENKFRQAQKMEALGTLVGGIAHDFNNMLAGMTGNLYLAKKKSKDADVVKKLSTVEALSFRASDMIQQLLVFARKGRVELKIFDLVPFINDVMKMFEVVVPENISVRKELCQDNLFINGDATQLQQVLMNLVNNARDALIGVDDPAIIIKLEKVDVDEVFKRKYADVTASMFARITVQDNGCGVNEDDLEHVFEPFFTTKETGSGTGLGLAMSYGAIHNHGGIIEVSSAPDQGTTFEVYLPLSDTLKVSADEQISDDVVQGHGETILLVDDDPDMRSASRDVLESLHYCVIEAEDGVMAIEMFLEYQVEIALVIMDVVMPRMGGVEAIRRISEFSDDVKVIYCTGYDRGEILNNSALSGIECIVSKPYQIHTFSKVVREKLDS
ncbi:MAG: PAS domain S-box protein [Mariprofundus sp.]|nr:PAS domain S-box protein [Mariprofundus sp.]